MTTSLKSEEVQLKRPIKCPNIHSKAFKHVDLQISLTKSKYSGLWCRVFRRMEGYGTYTYPDGSRYQGYFKNGLFNGQGLIHLAKPYNFNYLGDFIDGHMVKIKSMWFDDGLHVTAHFDDWHMYFDKWQYCTISDRRYFKELRNGIKPVGPTAYLTHKMPPRHLPPDVYDMEEGLYYASSKLLCNRPPPFPSYYFILCPLQQNWIKEKCRQSDDISIKNISAKYLQSIINNNLDWSKELGEYPPSYNIDIRKQRKKCYDHLCKIIQNWTDSNTTSLNITDTDTCEDSFSHVNVKVNLQEVLTLNNQYDEKIWQANLPNTNNEIHHCDLNIKI